MAKEQVGRYALLCLPLGDDGETMRDDARAHDSAELTGVECGDWRLVGGLSEVGQGRSSA
jgi:hypothetical protein